MEAAAMSTKRKPISRPPRVQITPLAIRLFTEMAAIPCTCPSSDGGGKYREHQQCAGCERWWELHRQLHVELRCRPWQWPCIEHPYSVCPFPEGSYAAQSWRANEEARQMWQALARAAKEARRTMCAQRSQDRAVESAR
jgi:hypothetical protein